MVKVRRIQWSVAHGLIRLVAIGLVAVGLVAVWSGIGSGGPAAAVPSGADSFTIAGAVYAAPLGGLLTTQCSGPPVMLFPGVTRCLVLQVENHLDEPLSVTYITVALDPNLPHPPSGCGTASLDLPTFSGALAVPASGKAFSPGLPIGLLNTSANQDDCKATTLHFVFSGIAERPSTAGPSGDLAATGADLRAPVALGLSSVLLGALALLVYRDRRRGQETT